MKNTLNSNLNFILTKIKQIDFEIVHHHKGNIIEINCGNLNKDDYGNIFEQLEIWLGAEEFYEFLLRHNNLYDFKGWIVKENQDIAIYVAFNGPFEDEFDPISLQFDDDFFKNKLQLKSIVTSENEFNADELKVNFELEIGETAEFASLSLLYQDNEMSLDKYQIDLLKYYLLELVKKDLPHLNIQFDCIQYWTVNCLENDLDFKISTSPIKFNFNEI